MSLIQSLGLSAVSGDPNDLPVGKYDGEVSESEFVLSETKNKISHVVTYKVTEGPNTGGTKQVWYDLFDQIKDAEGNFPKSVDQIVAGNPLMTEQNKNWYKKAIMDVTGCTPAEADVMEPAGWKGHPVTFGIAEKNGYRNVSFVESRKTAGAQQATAGLSFGGAPVSQSPGMPGF